MSAPSFPYSPVPSKDKGDVESATAPPYPSAAYGIPPPPSQQYQPAAPTWPSAQPAYQPFPSYPQYYDDTRYSYGYPQQAPPTGSDYPVIGSYQPGPDAFVELSVRHGFIRKVFGLVSMQVLLTTVIAGVICFSPVVKQQLQAHPGLFWLSFGASIAMMMVLMCNESVRRRYPLNILLLFGFTAAEGLLLGVASSQYDTNLVVLALALTTIITACLALYAVQTTYDFTTMGGILFAAGFNLVIVSIIYMFFPYWKPAELVVSGFGALIFSGYIVYDVQLLMGGEHSVQISPEEYIFAAMNIYMDIINLFLYLLRFLQALQDD